MTAAHAPLSARGRLWRVSDADSGAVVRMMAVAGLPEPAARVLVGRGVAPDQAEALIRPTLRALTPDPSSLVDMDVAATRLADAVACGEVVGVLTDYDVDGAASAALLIRLLRLLDVETRLEAPDRLRDGYGPNIGALRRLRDAGASVICCLDCGATAHAPLRAAVDEAIPVIVLDHHQADGSPPPALAVVNPNRMDDESGMGALAAVGVVFLLGVALLRTLRKRGFFAADRLAPDLKTLLDLVALGTVADVAPLHGLNRAFVAQGLKVMAQRRNPGLDALMAVARIGDAPDAGHCGFALSPRINAGGRVGRAEAGTLLLIEDDPDQAAARAAALDEDNKRRKAIEAETLAAAAAQAAAAADAPAILVAGEGWHPGVIGIVAGRLADRAGKPAFVFAWTGDEAKGSGRAPPGWDLGAAVIAARRDGLLLGGGGHAAAAGATVTRERFEAFRDTFMAWAVGRPATIPETRIDAVVAPAGADAALADALAALAPFGAGFPEPQLSVEGVLEHIRPMGAEGRHCQLRLTGAAGGMVDAVCFGADPAGGGGLGPALRAAQGKPLRLLGPLRIDAWNGRRRARLFVEDCAPPR